ncbi:Ornithine decarboxylase [Dirofilaria immitis]|nr:Ornithine decarboxylase [Dirofilaria immitis]
MINNRGLNRIMILINLLLDPVGVLLFVLALKECEIGATSVQIRCRVRACVDFDFGLKPEKLLKISPEEHTDGSSPPSNQIPQSVIRELYIALLSSDPIPRPGSAQIKLDVNAEPPWDPDPLFSASLPPEKPCHWTEVVKRRTFCVHSLYQIIVMAPVPLLDIYNNYSCDEAYRIADRIVKQCDLKAIYDDDCFDVVRKLITVKVAKGDYDPFFVMNVEIINDVLENWFKKMPDVKPFYALRCNPDDVLLKVLTQNIDMGLCCSNRYEVEMAMKIVGVNRIIYRNPMWTRGNIRHAKECGIQTVIIETEDDLKRFTTYYSEARIILRVTMDRKMINDPLTDDNLDVEKAINLLRSTKYPSVRIRGISFSIRSICTTPTIYSYAIAQCRRLFDIGLEVGHKMEILDVGDGFPSMSAIDGLSFDQIAKSLHAALEFFFPSKLFKHIKIIAEPGAYFATSPFSLVTRVIDKRLIDGSFLTNDESDVGTIGYIYQINEGFYGAFGCKLLTHRNPICSPLMIFGEKMSTYAAVIGPESCDTDVILSLTRLPPLQVGDWLIWHDMGAYTIASHDISERENPSLVIQYYYRSEKIATLFSHSKTLSSEDITTETDNSSGNSVCDTSRAEFSHTNAVNIIEKQFKT